MLLLSLRSHSFYRIRYRTAVAPLSLRSCPDVASLSLHCHSVIDLLLLRCCSAAASVAPFPLHLLLLSLLFHFCYLSCCHYTVTPAVDLVFLWCRSGVPPLLFRYQFAIAPLLLRFRCCHCCCLSIYCSCCHSTAVAWIVNGCRLKRQNQGNSFHW